MPRISKKEESQRLERLHRITAQHEPAKPDLRFWLVHVLHWHVAIVAAVAVSLVVLTAMSSSRVDASSDWPVYLQDQP